ncbi:unnamed protein product, partial [Tetraodon nigroviridis]
LGDQFYQEAIEHCRSYNARLCAERSVRMPFLDSQTGVAQNNCYIWMEKRQRQPGQAAGQMYTYPARCWRKKRRLLAPLDPQLRLCELRLEAELAPKREVPPGEATALEALLRGEGVLEKKNNLCKEEETLLEIQRVLEAEENGDGFQDDEEFELDAPKRKSRSRNKNRGSSRRRTEPVSIEDQDKPYVCDNNHKRENQTLRNERKDPCPDTEAFLPAAQKGPDGAVVPNDYCDFCLGDQDSNKKTGQAEELVSCSDCGRSGHPTCLQFTDNMMQAVQTYQWQCIECKSCSICGTSENDVRRAAGQLHRRDVAPGFLLHAAPEKEQLLFAFFSPLSAFKPASACRPFRTSCCSVTTVTEDTTCTALKPPMTQPPEGSWSCHLCLALLKDKASAY